VFLIQPILKTEPHLPCAYERRWHRDNGDEERRSSLTSFLRRHLSEFQLRKKGTTPRSASTLYSIRLGLRLTTPLPAHHHDTAKLKTVLNRVAQAASVKGHQTGSGQPPQQPRAGRAAPAPPAAAASNPFAAPKAQPQPSAAAAAPPPAASRRVLDLRPVEDDVAAAPPPRPPKTVK